MAGFRRWLLLWAVFSAVLAGGAGRAATQTVTYDALGRVTSVITPDGKQTIYTYDAAGNRTSVTVSSPASGIPSESNYSLTYNYGSPAPTFDPRTTDTTDPIVGVSPAQFGTTNLTCLPNCLVTYMPSATEVAGLDAFSYTVQNSTTGLTASALVLVTLVNPAPIANPDNITVAEGSFIQFDPRVNDSDPGGLTFTITGASTPSHGARVINSGTSITYTPSAGFWGADTFTYTITDTANQSATANIFATVTATPPTAGAISLGTAKNTALTFDPRAYATDPQGLGLTVTGVTTPAHGTAVINNGGTSVTFNPTSGYTGTTTFNYTVTNSGGGSASATVTVTVGAALAISLDYTTWNWHRFFAGNTIIAAAINATVSGGQSPYTVAWQCVSQCTGYPDSAATAPAWISTQWTGTVPEDGNTYTAYWLVKVTDNLGAVVNSAQVAVNFEWDGQ